MVVGSSQKRGSDQALCVHTAGFKGITRAQRTAGGPRELSSLDLFIPQKIGRVSLWYLSAASRYATHGPGSAKTWQPQTPAMAAGLTDHGWTLREVLLYRVPPWPQPAGV